MTTLASLVAMSGGGVASLRAQTPPARKGALLLEEDFRRYETYTKERLPVADGWQVRVAHGIWTRTAEGVQSVETPNHQPVLVFEGNFGDVIVELDFRYRVEPDKWAACRISTTNHELHPRAYAASMWANVDYKSRAVGVVLEHDQWGGHVTQVARKMTELAPDTWHRLRLEIVGDRASAECEGAIARGRHPRFALPKSALWLATGLSTHELRRLRVYEASA
ncbi:hypothetical protein ASA1KI_17220 [Opitutales bacterium ASA1]|uniref:hypothetical protein n=1 Tax=Congregicoccus parvus TaxID=3081749 RepID=UPI002B314D87|nr:hypothetical protein ASA1KI_17220 [Opitutales bacterium ASA1]